MTMPMLTPGLLFGLEAMVLAAVIWLLGPTIRESWPAVALLLRWGPLAVLLVGLGLVGLAVFGERTPDADRANPVARTVDSIAAGATLYQANCSACHGADARGGGPLSATTSIRPPSLVSGHLLGHSEGDVFYWISNGLPGGMPAWASQLSETDRSNLVNYLLSLNGQGPGS